MMVFFFVETYIVLKQIHKSFDVRICLGTGRYGTFQRVFEEKN